MKRKERREEGRKRMEGWKRKRDRDTEIREEGDGLGEGKVRAMLSWARGHRSDSRQEERGERQGVLELAYREILVSSGVLEWAHTLHLCFVHRAPVAQHNSTHPCLCVLSQQDPAQPLSFSASRGKLGEMKSVSQQVCFTESILCFTESVLVT